MQKGSSSHNDDASAPWSQSEKLHDLPKAATRAALEDMSRKRKQEHDARLSNLDDICSSIRREEVLAAKEKQRQMSMIYSRRKRVRKSQRIDELTEASVSFR